jgi:hypothetical protein
MSATVARLDERVNNQGGAEKGPFAATEYARLSTVDWACFCRVRGLRAGSPARERYMIRICLAAIAVALTAGCSTTPSVTKQRMTLGEANIEGMECRREKPIGTNRPRTVCASPEAWAAFDAQAAYESDLAFQKARSGANSGPFNRQ